MAFIFGGDTGETYESLQRKRKVADALIARSAQTPRNMGEGLTAIGNALAGGLLARKARQDEAAGQKEFGKIYDALISGGGAFGVPAADAPRGPSFEPEYSPEQYRDAIASIESAGSGDYSAMGPETDKGRAYGKYQVMDFNVGPWTEEVLGQAMTPDQFLASPEAQDAVFDAKFGQSVEKYGNPQDAASVWFSGQPMAKAKNASDGYATVPEYVEKFNTALGEPVMPEPPQVQASPGIDPRLLAALGNPYASPQQQAVLQALVQQQILHNAPPKPITPYQQKQLELRQAELDAKISGKIQTGTTVNVGGKGETKWQEETAKGQAQMMTDWAKSGVDAQGEIAQIETLDALMGEGIGGDLTNWQIWARDSLGINTLNKREEAVEAMINQLVPTQRPPGSGQMSDKDLELFKQSLPSLMNSPEGNALILDTMRGMAQYKRQLGEIAQQAIIGTRPDGTPYSRHDAMKDMYALPDPLEGFRASLPQEGEGKPSPGNTAAPAGGSDQQLAAPDGFPAAKWGALDPDDQKMMLMLWPDLSEEDKAKWRN